MGRPKKSEVVEEVEVDGNDIDSIIKQLDKEYGKGIAVPASTVLDKKKQVISVSPALDNILGGGIPEGSWISIAGQEKCGKTVTALTFASECQKPENGGRFVVYANVEHRIKARDLKGIAGLKTDPKHFYMIQSTKGKILGAIDYLNICSKFINEVPGCLVIIDSVSAMMNQKLLTDGLGSSDYGAGNRVIGQFCDSNEAVVPLNDCLVLGIIHYYANTSGMGAAKNEKAASRWKYQSDCAIQCKGFQFWRNGGNDTPPIGLETDWLVKTSAIGPPGQKGKSFIRFGVGIDKIYELTLIAQDFGLIEASGSWFSLSFLNNVEEKTRKEILTNTELEDKQEYKLQGGFKVSQFLENNPLVCEQLSIQLRGMLGS